MSPLGIALLAALLLCIAASLWHAATAFRDHPLLILAIAAATAVIITAIIPPLRILGLVALTVGAHIAFWRWLDRFLTEDAARRTSPDDPDSPGLTAFSVLAPFAVTALYAVTHALPWPDTPPSPWLHDTIALLPTTCLTSTAFALRAIAWSTVAAHFTAPGPRLSPPQAVLFGATTIPPLVLCIGGWGSLLAVGTFGPGADHVLRTLSTVSLWLTAALVLPGFPLAWWWATRLHRRTLHSASCQ